MLSIQVDEKVVEKLFFEELKKRLDRIERSRTLWDFKELCRQTCMSDTSIREKFFYDPRFPKYKISGKWYMPAKEAEEFLLMWIKEQSTR